MSRKLKLKGALRAYLLWPVFLTVLLLFMDLSIYALNKRAALVASGFTVLYFALAGIIYYSKRSKIASTLIFRIHFLCAIEG
jgi:hypothetical protein